MSRRRARAGGRPVETLPSTAPPRPKAMPTSWSLPPRCQRDGKSSPGSVWGGATDIAPAQKPADGASDALRRQAFLNVTLLL